MQLFKAFEQKSFILLWFGQTVSQLGDSLYRTALIWWVLQQTQSAAAMSGFSILGFLPTILFSLIGGVVVDRFPRFKVMVGSDLLRGVIVAGVTILTFSHIIALWQFYTASITFGIVSAFFRPAYNSIVPEIILPEYLPSANALNSLSSQLVNIIGPSLAALIIAISNTSTAFGLDALSFFVSALCLFLMPHLSITESVAPKKTSPFKDLKGGLHFVVSVRWPWMIIAANCIATATLSSPMNVSLPFLIKDNLHGDVAAVGLVYTIIALGAVSSALTIGRLKIEHKRGWLIYLLTAAVGLTILILGVSGTLWLALVAGFAGGFVDIIVDLTITHLLQERIPKEIFGRVSSIITTGIFLLLPIGAALAGWATDKVGAPLIFVICGIGTMVVAVWGLSQPAIRHLD